MDMQVLKSLVLIWHFDLLYIQLYEKVKCRPLQIQLNMRFSLEGYDIPSEYITIQAFFMPCGFSIKYVE
jgi:hypothetical protein